MVSECKFKKMCPICGKKHNGLLHFDGEKNENRNERSATKEYTKKSYVATSVNNEIVCATAHDQCNIGTLLATALIRIKTKDGWSEKVRALIDQGSMSSFIDEKPVKKLNLKQRKSNINICGIAGSIEPAKGTVELQFSACYPTSFKANVDAIILNKLTTFLPNRDFDTSVMQNNELELLTLADPQFNKSAKIDMILGADVYAALILDGIIKAHDNSYIAQETEVGWIVSGPITKRNKNNNNMMICMVSSINEIDEKMQKFWELEEISGEKFLNPEDEQCMDIFLKQSNETAMEHTLFHYHLKHTQNRWQFKTYGNGSILSIGKEVQTRTGAKSSVCKLHQ